MGSVIGGRLTIWAGPFHPDLEKGLHGYLESRQASIRKSHRLIPCAIVLPSEEIRRYLKRLITLRWRMTLAGVHLLTVDSLALRIVATGQTGQTSRRADGLVLADRVRDIVLTKRFPAEWGGFVRFAGGAAAILRTLGNLEEARIPLEIEKGDPLLRLHRLYQTERKQLGLGTPTDTVEQAIQVASGSRFLQSLEGVVYYGFYDMTQIQLDLLTRISTICQASMFFPSVAEHRAYDFANGFLEELRARFEEVQHKVAANLGAAEDRPSTSLRPAMNLLFSENNADTASQIAKDSLRFYTASGPEAELEITAKEILRWTEEGIDFSEIGIIARTLDPYLPFLYSVFTGHDIPFRTPEALSISRLPWVKALGALNRIVADEFSKMDVLEWTTSPYSAFRDEEAASDHGARLALRQARSIRKLEGWKKFIKASPTELSSVLLPLQHLIEAVERFPRRCKWGDFIDIYRKFLKEALIIPDMESEAISDLRMINVKSPWDLIESTLESVGIRKGSTQEVETKDFILAVDEQLLAYEVPYWNFAHSGVEVLNARDARAKQFAAVVVMGLQEGVWPRRENDDPFLGEGMRGSLSKKYSARLLKRSEAAKEERLLFTLALTSAMRYVTLTCQRSAEDSRPLVRSWYVHEVGRSLGYENPGLSPEISVDRRLGDRFNKGFFAKHLWTPSEWSAYLTINGQDPSELSKSREIPGEILKNCFDAGIQLEQLEKKLSDRDGMTGTLPSLLATLSEKGFSPTSLQHYAECPFQFFAKYALALESLPDLKEPLGLEAKEKGNILHSIFHRFFKAWLPSREADVADLIRSIIESTLKDTEKEVSMDYPLLWDWTKGELYLIAERYILEELRSLQESGYQPMEHEKSLEMVLQDVSRFSSILRGIKIQGRLDRIDRREGRSGIEIRVVDYKYQNAKKSFTSKNSRQDALRGKKLQPPFYVLLAEDYERGAKAEAELHYLAPNWSDRVDFPSGQWDSEWAQDMSKSLDAIIGGIRDGHFYPIPEPDNCKKCSYQGLCRKNHRSTRYRKEADGRTKTLEKLVNKRWSSKA